MRKDLSRPDRFPNVPAGTASTYNPFRNGYGRFDPFHPASGEA